MLNRRLSDLIERPLKRLLLSLRPPRAVRHFLLWPVTSRLFGTAARKTVPLGNGCSIEVGLDDELNRALWYYAPEAGLFWEPATTAFLRRLAPEKRSIVIAGAHIGYTLLAAADVLAPDARILSFEPIPALCARARANVERNGLSGRIEVRAAALSDRNGRVAIEDEAIRSSIVRTNGRASGGNVHDVEAVTLADAVAGLPAGKADLVFLDIEGYEFPVLQAARALLERDAPDLVLEVSPKILRRAAHTEEDLYALLEGLGYALFLIEDDYHLDRIGERIADPVLVPLRSEEFKRKRDEMYFNVFATKTPR